MSGVREGIQSNETVIKVDKIHNSNFLVGVLYNQGEVGVYVNQKYLPPLSSFSYPPLIDSRYFHKQTFKIKFDEGEGKKELLIETFNI